MSDDKKTDGDALTQMGEAVDKITELMAVCEDKAQLDTLDKQSKALVKKMRALSKVIINKETEEYKELLSQIETAVADLQAAIDDCKKITEAIETIGEVLEVAETFAKAMG